PVVRVTQETERLGGAANVALNVESLGGSVSLAGGIGSDLAGAHLAKATRGPGIDTRFVSLKDRATTVKTRVMAHQQQMVRTDREVTDLIATAVEAKLLKEASKV